MCSVVAMTASAVVWVGVLRHGMRTDTLGLISAGGVEFLWLPYADFGKRRTRRSTLPVAGRTWGGGPHAHLSGET
jgi:hypothetical protein